jgi:hypothetical protein
MKTADWMRRLTPIVIRMLLAGRIFLAGLFAVGWISDAKAEAAGKNGGLERICELIEQQSKLHALPSAFLARLIWKESRFDGNAVSPKGAEGIAQFMPSTAAMRGLADAFDIEQAIPASASYLAHLTAKYGNLGLAAAAYNAGEGRISRWLARGGFLPLETEDFVRDILGEAVDRFVERQEAVTVAPLEGDKPFKESCRSLPFKPTTRPTMASAPQQPWGVQVAGHFRRGVALEMWQRARAAHPQLFAGYEPVVSRVRTTRARRSIYAVRVGAETRKKANDICAGMRREGASCVVMKNK